MPAVLRQLTLGTRAGRALRPVARIRTERDAHVIRSEDGTPLAELVIDTVTATRTRGEREVISWREIEVELKDGDEALLRRAATWLRTRGATPSAQSSKLARALHGVANGDGVATDDLQGAVRTYLSAQETEILAGDLALRRDLLHERGDSDDVVHATRVATRRYRSVLRVFADRFDAGRTAALNAELKWYASSLGAVRDLQVLAGHLGSTLAQLPDDLVLGPVASRIDRTLAAELREARARLGRVLRSRRYLALVQELRAWSQDPPCRGDGSTAAKRVRRYLRRAETKLERRLAKAHRLAVHDPERDEALHRARKAAKRARYTAELAAPVIGKPARSSRKAAKRLQSELGDRQDAVLAVTFLRRLGAVAGTTPGENGFTFGVLLARELHRGRLG